MKVKDKLNCLRQKILCEAQITHNNLQYELADLMDKQQSLQSTLRINLKQFKNGIDRFTQQYELKIKEFTQILDEEQTYEKFININTLKNYLNEEKAVLKKLIQNEPQSLSNNDRLHYLVKRRNLQEIYQHIQKKQLQIYIKNLEENIINSKVVLYEIPEDKMTLNEEQLLNQKIKTFLSEVERLTQLEQNCKVGDISHSTSVQTSLKKQTQRLEKVENFLQKEQQYTKKLQEQMSQINIPSYEQKKSQKTSQKIHLNINKSEYGKVMKLWNPTEGIISLLGSKNQELKQELKTIKQQVKRLE